MTAPRRVAGPRVHKTYKLFIGGAFCRSESGRTRPLVVTLRGQERVFARIARASRKDLRNAVQAACKARAGWAGASGMLRGQILHRMAEMLDARAAELEGLLVETKAQSPKAAAREVADAADLCLWYAGWCDKLPQVLGTVNPVAGPYFNFSMPEPTGVVAVLPPPRPALAGLIACLAPVLVPGNTTVVVASIEAAPVAVTFAEIAATSDLPAGVFNLLTGDRNELLPWLAAHRGIDANLCVTSDASERKLVETEAADHVKRGGCVERAPDRDLAAIARFVEIKTAWHTMGV